MASAMREVPARLDVRAEELILAAREIIADASTRGLKGKDPDNVREYAEEVVHGTGLLCARIRQPLAVVFKRV